MSAKLRRYGAHYDLIDEVLWLSPHAEENSHHYRESSDSRDNQPVYLASDVDAWAAELRALLAEADEAIAERCDCDECYGSAHRDRRAKLDELLVPDA